MSGATVKATVERNAPHHGGKIYGDDGYMLSVEFNDLIDASEFIHQFGLRRVARIISDGNGVSETGFTKPVVIQFDISKESNA